jgi:hypothetical protein
VTPFFHLTGDFMTATVQSALVKAQAVYDDVAELASQPTLSQIISDRDTAIQAKNALQGRIDNMTADMDALDQADTTADQLRAQLRQHLG